MVIGATLVAAEVVYLGGVCMTFSPRETAILQLLAVGLSDKQVAVKLGISRHTVRTHIDRLLRKHAVHSRTALVVRYLTAGTGATK